MKLVFKKNENGDVSVTMFKGTAEAQFSYIEMIKALIAGEPLDADFDESNVEFTNALNISVSPRNTTLHNATIKATAKKAIQI